MFAGLTIIDVCDTGREKPAVFFFALVAMDQALGTERWQKLHPADIRKALHLTEMQTAESKIAAKA